MDPSISIDLSSVAGIVALTLMLVHYLKPQLGRITFLQELPIAVFVVLISSGLTWLAHDVLHKLEGDLTSLITQAILSALAASGAVEWWRAGTKPVADSRSAVDARNTVVLIPLLLVLGLSSSACASLGVGHSLVRAETVIHDAIGITVSTGNRLCDSRILDAPRCVQFNERLIPIIQEAKAFNNAIASNSSASIPSMVLAIEHLARDVAGLMPEGADRAAVMAKVNEARAILRSIRGGR